LTPIVEQGQTSPQPAPITVQTYAWFARHHDSVSRDTYQLVIADEAHTALGEKTSLAIRSFPDPIYIGMTATEQLIAKQVSDVFPASVDDLPLQDAARRGLIAPLRNLRVPPAAAIHSVPIVGGDFEERALAAVLDHTALNQAAASLYRDRFDSTPGIVYAAGVDHAYNLAKEFRAAGLKAEAVSGRTPPVKLAEILAAYERGEIDILINAMLLAEGWNSPRATVVMHLAPTASRRVYQQRIGRIMRMHPRKEAGIVVDFVNKGATHNDRVISLHSLLGADFYREGARVTPAPRRRPNRRARRQLSPAPWLVPVTPDVRRRLAVIQREWQRIDPRYLDEDEQRYWASIAGRQVRFEERADFVKKLSDGKASKACLEQFLATAAAENPNRRLRMMALSDRVSMTVERADFDDLVTLVIQGATWDKDRVQGSRILLRAIGEGKADAPEQILARWTWKLARATRKAQDRRVSAEFPEAKRLLGALANSRGHRHEENAAKLVNAALELPIEVGVALLASADGYTPRATKLIEGAREKIGTLPEVAYALAENLPPPKAHSGRRRRRRRKKKGGQQGQQTGEAQTGQQSRDGAQPKKRRRRRKPARTDTADTTPEQEPEPARAAEAS
jgi:superfamily II DNA or RNA helicase